MSQPDEKQDEAQYQKVQEALSANPPRVQDALQLLEPLLGSAASNPRRELVLAMKCALQGDRVTALRHAEAAKAKADDILREAGALIERLSK